MTGAEPLVQGALPPDWDQLGGFERTLAQMFHIYFNPEIERRRADGILPEPFGILTMPVPGLRAPFLLRRLPWRWRFRRHHRIPGRPVDGAAGIGDVVERPILSHPVLHPFVERRIEAGVVVGLSDP